MEPSISVKELQDWVKMYRKDCEEFKKEDERFFEGKLETLADLEFLIYANAFEIECNVLERCDYYEKGE